MFYNRFGNVDAQNEKKTKRQQHGMRTGSSPLNVAHIHLYHMDLMEYLASMSVLCDDTHSRQMINSKHVVVAVWTMQRHILYPTVSVNYSNYSFT